MSHMTPDLARLIVAERLDDADLRRRHREARATTAGPRVPQQRRGGGLLARIRR